MDFSSDHLGFNMRSLTICFGAEQSPWSPSVFTRWAPWCHSSKKGPGDEPLPPPSPTSSSSSSLQGLCQAWTQGRECFLLFVLQVSEEGHPTLAFSQWDIAAMGSPARPFPAPHEGPVRSFSLHCTLQLREDFSPLKFTEMLANCPNYNLDRQLLGRAVPVFSVPS